jgi:hypothetical protein
MKRPLPFLAMILLMTTLNAQVQPDTIQVKKKLGTVFQINGENVSPGKMLKIMEPNPMAHAEMKIANTNYVVSMIFSCAGGFVIGYQIGSSVVSGEPEWTAAGVGAGLLIVAIPFAISYTKHAKNAVYIYNRGVRNSSGNPPEMTFNISPTGTGLKIRF